jgi:O-antigen ligase
LLAYKYINQYSIYNFLLFIWIVSVPFKNAFYQISTALLVLFLIVYVILRKDYTHFKQLLLKYKNLFIILFLLIVSMTISNLANDMTGTKAWIIELSFIYKVVLLLLSFLYFYSKDFFSRKILLSFIIISLSIQVFDGIYQSIYGYDIFKHNIGDLQKGLTGATYGRTVYGFFMGISTMLFYLLIDKNYLLSKKNIFFIFMLLISIFCLLFSYSRGAWVSLFIVLVSAFLINIKSLNKNHLIFISSLSLIVLIVFFNIDSLANRFNLLINNYSNARYDVWLHAINLIEEKPFLGWGIDAFRIYGYKHLTSIHNSLLEILFSIGLVGLIIWIIFHYFIFKKIYLNKDFVSLCFLLFIFINTLFDRSVTTGKIFWSIFVLLLFFIFTKEKERL